MGLEGEEGREGKGRESGGRIERKGRCVRERERERCEKFVRHIQH